MNISIAQHGVAHFSRPAESKDPVNDVAVAMLDRCLAPPPGPREPSAPETQQGPFPFHAEVPEGISPAQVVRAIDVIAKERDLQVAAFQLTDTCVVICGPRNGGQSARASEKDEFVPRIQ
jgi:hypothetical protein